MMLKDELKRHIVIDLQLKDIDPESIDDEAPLFGQGLGLDSLDAVELVIVVQKHFGLKIKDMDEAKLAFASISALAGYIEARTAVGC